MSGKKLAGYPVLMDGRVRLNPKRWMTRRQQEVWNGIAMSGTSKSIAFGLGISPKTAEFHRAKLMKQLGIYNVAGLTRAAYRIGLIDVKIDDDSGRNAIRTT